MPLRLQVFEVEGLRSFIPSKLNALEIKASKDKCLRGINAPRLKVFEDKTPLRVNIFEAECLSNFWLSRKKLPQGLRPQRVVG